MVTVDKSFVFLNSRRRTLGNFRSLIPFRIDAGDSALANHFSTTNKMTNYISMTSQNELIEICGSFIGEQIINEI